MNRSIGTVACQASFLVFVLAALAAGCEEAETPTGTLLVRFQLGNGTATCGDENVITVRGTLDDGLYEADVDCAADDDEGEVLFSDVEEGEYPLQLVGLDDEGVPVVDTPVLPVEVVFEGDKNSMEYESTVSLSTAPARLQIRWDLGVYNCESTEIYRFRIVAYGSNGMKTLLDTDLDCSLMGEGKEQYRRVPDPDRYVDGEMLDAVEVNPLDKNDVEIGDPVLFSLSPPGPGRTVNLTVECTDAGCEGSGEPD